MMISKLQDNVCDMFLTKRLLTVTCLTLGILVYFMSYVFLAHASVQSDTQEQVRVFVHFDSVPGKTEQGLVRAFGGKVTHSYSIIPALAVTIPQQAIEGLSKNPHVTSIELDHEVKATEIYDEEYYRGWGIDHVHSGVAHEQSILGQGVKVGVIDSGVDSGHQDLDVVGGYNFWNYNENYEDVYGHGTHVAGTICALDNGLGVVGVSPLCNLYSLRVLSDEGSGYESDIIYAIEWALGDTVELWYDGEFYGTVTGEKLDVVNMSIGSQSASSAYEEACNAAYAKGLVLVAAAGNDGRFNGRGDTVDYPARYSSVIAVAAVDQNNVRATWSSTGPDVEISAPGVSVISAWNDDSSHYDPQPTLIDGDYYKPGSGTSMATPHVTGAVALLLSAGVEDMNGVNGVADEVRSILGDSATPLGKVEEYGAGLVNIQEALQILVVPTGNTSPVADAGADQVLVDSNSDGTETFTLDGTASTDKENNIISYLWNDENDVVVGTASTVEVTKPIGEYLFTLTVTDSEGLYSTDTVLIDVRTLEEKCTPALARKGLCVYTKGR